jgi:predicted restriction endonuclease
MDFRFIPYEGKSEKQTLVNQIIGQSFFRRAVLANFEERCCITGIAEPKILVASHIRPWASDVINRHNPANGFLLSATMDRAFDCGLITINTSSLVRISQKLLTSSSCDTRNYFSQYENYQIRPPTRFRPDNSFIEWHMKEVFLG